MVSRLSNTSKYCAGLAWRTNLPDVRSLSSKFKMEFVTCQLSVPFAARIHVDAPPLASHHIITAVGVDEDLVEAAVVQRHPHVEPRNTDVGQRSDICISNALVDRAIANFDNREHISCWPSGIESGELDLPQPCRRHVATCGSKLNLEIAIFSARKWLAAVGNIMIEEDRWRG